MLLFWLFYSWPWLGCAKILTKPHRDSDKQMESKAVWEILNDVIMSLRNSTLSIKIKFQENNGALISLSQALVPIRQANSVQICIPEILWADSEMTVSGISKRTALKLLITKWHVSQISWFQIRIPSFSRRLYLCDRECCWRDVYLHVAV